jgi:DUF2993 family protein
MRKLLVFLIVVGLLVVAGDRIARKLASDEAEKRLVAEGLTSPTVDVRGFPFLTQLLSRHFDDVVIKTPSVRAGTGRAEQVSATARDVHVPSSGAAVVGNLTARGTVPYSEVLHRVGRKGLRLSDAGSGQVRLQRDITVLGQSYAVVARGRVEPRGDRLEVTPTSLQLADGGAVDERLSQLLAGRFTFSYRLGGLPDGIRIDRIAPDRDGFVVDISGRDLRWENLSSAARALRATTVIRPG